MEAVPAALARLGRKIVTALAAVMNQDAIAVEGTRFARAICGFVQHSASLTYGGVLKETKKDLPAHKLKPQTNHGYIASDIMSIYDAVFPNHKGKAHPGQGKWQKSQSSQR